MSPNEFEHQPERRTDGETRKEVDDRSAYLLSIARELDEQISLDTKSGTKSQKAETLTTQLAMLQNRLIYCCEGHLHRERPNAVFQEVANQMTNKETIDILLSKVKKGLHEK